MSLNLLKKEIKDLIEKKEELSGFYNDEVSLATLIIIANELSNIRKELEKINNKPVRSPAYPVRFK